MQRNSLDKNICKSRWITSNSNSLLKGDLFRIILWKLIKKLPAFSRVSASLSTAMALQCLNDSFKK